MYLTNEYNLNDDFHFAVEIGFARSQLGLIRDCIKKIEGFINKKKEQDQ